MAQLVDLRMFFLLTLKGLAVWSPSLPAYKSITHLLEGMLNAILGMKKWRVSEPLEYLKTLEYKLLRPAQIKPTPCPGRGQGKIEEPRNKSGNREQFC
jgi:hypothetical protein